MRAERSTGRQKARNREVEKEKSRRAPSEPQRQRQRQQQVEPPLKGDAGEPTAGELRGQAGERGRTTTNARMAARMTAMTEKDDD